MSTTLPATLKVDHPGNAPPARVDVDLVAAFLAGRRPTTLRAYRQDLADFARFVGAPAAPAAVEWLIGGTAGQANALALGYKADLIGRGLAPATVGRRLAALRSMVKLARTLGRCAWTLEIPSPRVEKLRDTAGPGDAGWRRVFELAKADAAGGSPRGLRDLAIVRLLHDLGLRRGELVAVNLAAVELGPDAGRIRITGKGRSESEALSLPGPVRRDLAAWIAARGPDPGPLFTRLDRAAAGMGRLTADGVHKLIGALGRRAGLTRPLRPHGLRHQGITAVLDRNGGDLRAAARFSRHRDLRTLGRYDDNRRDLAGQMARLISED